MPKKIEMNISSIKITLLTEESHNSLNLSPTRTFEIFKEKLNWSLSFKKQNIDQSCQIQINSNLKISSLQLKTEEYGDYFSFFEISNFNLISTYNLKENKFEQIAFIDMKNILSV